MPPSSDLNPEDGDIYVLAKCLYYNVMTDKNTTWTFNLSVVKAEKGGNDLPQLMCMFTLMTVC